MLALATLVSTFFVISFVITAGLLPGVGSSGAPLGRGSQAHAVAAQFVGTLLDTRYGVAGNFSHLAINYSVPHSLSAATRLYYAAHSGLSCGDLARRIEEPLTKHYRPTGRHPQVWHIRLVQVGHLLMGACACTYDYWCHVCNLVAVFNWSILYNLFIPYLLPLLL